MPVRHVAERVRKRLCMGGLRRDARFVLAGLL
jgi:hypothetical protein